MIKVDTNKLKECGTDMINLSLELKEQINGLFDALLNVEKRCWIGNSAKIFVANTKLEKAQYIKFAESLYNEGKFILNSTQSIDNKIEKIKW